MSESQQRLEHDLLGERFVPAEALYGIHTLRSLENFPISGMPIGMVPQLIRALACVKQAAATANVELGMLDTARMEAICAACAEIQEGQWLDHFVVDLIQGGAGTSTNMNANEVIANRGLEIMGHQRGDYTHLHPLDHVNMSQSTNDVYPTALGIALSFLIHDLLAAMARLRRRFEEKQAEFTEVLKMGRTQLQDAVPMTLGQEFSAYAVTLGEDEMRVREALSLLAEINLGATAIGTGINTHPAYAPLACGHLADITGLPLVTAANLVEATPDTGHYVQLSGVLKRVAVKLSKTCNDLRLLVIRPAGRVQRNQPAAHAGRVEHHARQGQPGHPGGRQPSGLRGGRLRHHRDDGRRSRAASAERLRADHRPRAVSQPHPSARRHRHARRTLHRRHHRKRRVGT